MYRNVVGCATQKWRSGGTRLPVVLKVAIHLAAAEGENGVGAADSPEHPGPFEARADNGLAASLDDARPDKQVLLAELGVAHAFGVLGEILGFGEDLPGQIRIGDWDGTERADQFLNLALVEVVLLDGDPARPLGLVQGE